MKRYLIAGAVLLALAFGTLVVSSAQAGPKPIPVLSFTPAGPYDYGSVAIGRTVPRDFTLSVVGAKGTIGPFTTSLLPASVGFSITTDTCKGKRISVNKPCKITVSYSPTWVGASSATLTASMNAGAFAATVSLSGTGFNNTAPTAKAVSVSTAANTAKTINLEASDADGDMLTFNAPSNPSHGTLGALNVGDCAMSIGGPSTCYASVTYTPDSGYSGTDSFTYTVNDGLTNSTAATVSITITGGGSETCTAGSEDFSGDALYSQPTTFAGGTIDSSYGAASGYSDAGGILSGASWGFVSGSHVLFTGIGVRSFQLTFTDPVASVQLDAVSNVVGASTLTLTAYDASGSVVDTDSKSNSSYTPSSLAVTSSSDNIDHFTIATTNYDGLAFTNIVWGLVCAAQPGLSINSPARILSNNQPNLTFTVSLSAASASTVTFDWAASDGAAGYKDAAIWGTSCDGTADYTSAAQTGTGTITAGQTTTTIVFGTCNNGPANVYPYLIDTYFTVTISNPSGATITTDTGIGNIGIS